MAHLICSSPCPLPIASCPYNPSHLSHIKPGPPFSIFLAPQALLHLFAPCPPLRPLLPLHPPIISTIPLLKTHQISSTSPDSLLFDPISKIRLSNPLHIFIPSYSTYPHTSQPPVPPSPLPRPPYASLCFPPLHITLHYSHSRAPPPAPAPEQVSLWIHNYLS